MLKVKCPDCFRECEIEEDVRLYICGCGGCAFDREEYNSQQVTGVSITQHRPQRTLGGRKLK
jgi:hypothetical protein